VTLRVRYWNGSWHPIASRSTEFSTHDWTWNLEGTVGARAYVRPEIEVEFYGVVGPGLDLEAYLGLDGSVEMPSCLYEWDLRVGVASHANFRAGILAWDFDHWEEDASGTGPTTTITMNGNRSVVAVFEEENECTTDVDCGPREACVGGKCEPVADECANDADCEAGEACVDGECVAEGGADRSALTQREGARSC